MKPAPGPAAAEATTGFSAEWLTLREPFDQAARNTALAQPGLAAHLERWRLAATGAPLEVLDLACGHGANLRALALRLGGPQRWRLVDNDAALLAALPPVLAGWCRQHGYRFTPTEGAGNAGGCHIAGPGFTAQVVCERIDLAQALPSMDLAAARLITSSALLDLVSAAWLQGLVQRARDTGAALLWALTVDGRTSWAPADPDDETVHRLFSRHQQRDKGFGPALGVQAPAMALQLLASAGYQATQAPSDWLIDGASAPAMQRAMIDGISTAAQQQDPAALPLVRAWQARRQATIGGCCLAVGHVDILATLR